MCITATTTKVATESGTLIVRCSTSPYRANIAAKTAANTTKKERRKPMKLEELLDTLDASRLCEIRELIGDGSVDCPILVPCFTVLDYVGDADVVKSLEAYMGREVADVEIAVKLKDDYPGFIVYVLTEGVEKGSRRLRS